mmetsp:Transcript_929/g.1799  ORF Transcript_929/g.1799 Transcript_929/m.1799 type:complete len:250 (+) Transcript_929:1097-1846(+)
MHGGDRGQRVFFPDRHLHPKTVVLVHAQEVVDDVEAAITARVIHGRDVDQGREAAGALCLQEVDEVYQIGGDHRHAQFAHGVDVGRHNVIGALLGEEFGQFLQGCGHVAPLSVRWCRCGGSSAAIAGCRRAAPQPSAGNRGRRCPRVRSDRSRARRCSCSDNSRPRSRRTPSRSRSAARASGRRPCAARVPSCWSACRPRSSRPTGAERRAARCRNALHRSAASRCASSPPRSRPARRSSSVAIRYAPS